MVSRAEQRRAIERARGAEMAAAVIAEYLGGSGSDDDDHDPELKFMLINGEFLALPRRSVELLVEILEALGDGQDPSVLPRDIELSTGELARILDVSRQYAARLLDDGRLPSRREGTHRRVKISDALAYRRSDDRRRRQAFRELAG